jgi:hypothetical protein
MVMSGSGKARDPILLTDKAIKALRPEAEPYRVPDVRAKGLALRVGADGDKMRWLQAAILGPL